MLYLYIPHENPILWYVNALSVCYDREVALLQIARGKVEMPFLYSRTTLLYPASKGLEVYFSTDTSGFRLAGVI